LHKGQQEGIGNNLFTKQLGRHIAFLIVVYQYCCKKHGCSCGGHRLHDLNK